MASGGGGNAMGLGDHRLGQGLDRQHHAGAAIEKVLKIGQSAITGLPALRHLFQVMPGTERLARPGQDHGPDCAILAQGIELGLQGGQHLVAQGIQTLGRVHRQACNCACVATFQNCHLALPLAVGQL